MNTLFTISMRNAKRVFVVIGLTAFLIACGGGGGGSIIPSIPIDALVESLFAQFDAGQISEESLIEQLASLGF